jgi:hypothetical protein
MTAGGNLLFSMVEKAIVNGVEQFVNAKQD